MHIHLRIHIRIQVQRICFSLGVEDVHLFSPDDLHNAANGAHYVYLNGLIIGVHRGGG